MKALLLALAIAAGDPLPLIHTGAARQQETGFGDAVADGMRAATHADIAWIAGGEFREIALNRGGAGDQNAAVLLDDPAAPLVVLSLSGRTIREALEWGLQQYPKPGKAFLNISGLRVAFGPPLRDGRRVRAVALPGGELAPDRHYRVAMTRTLAAGSFGFFRFWPEARGARAEPVTVGEAARQALVKSPVVARGDGRMVEKAGE
jgi:2',3'-cyclic-nucleotide 2'-phosphodiesterase (5'-nucleotidase family)